MKRKTQIRLALLLVNGVAAVGDVMLRELPNKILADLNRAPAHRAVGRLPLAAISFTTSR